MMEKVDQLSRRERQIMDVLHARGEAAAQEVREGMPEAPGYSAVRALLRILEEKGHVKHREEGRRYLYSPRAPMEKARQSALQRVVSTFFGGSRRQMIAALLESEDVELSDGDLRRMREIISKGKKNGR